MYLFFKIVLALITRLLVVVFNKVKRRIINRRIIVHLLVFLKIVKIDLKKKEKERRRYLFVNGGSI